MVLTGQSSETLATLATPTEPEPESESVETATPPTGSEQDVDRFFDTGIGMGGARSTSYILDKPKTSRTIEYEKPMDDTDDDAPNNPACFKSCRS